MSAANDGGPAFPCQPLDAQGNPCNAAQYGMSMRDWFAGQALAGDMASQNNEQSGVWPNDAKNENLIARSVLIYRIADAMLAAREKKL